MASNQPPAPAPSVGELKELCSLVIQLVNPEQRENALVELSKKRESFPDLAPILWFSFGAITALLQEIISIYPMLSPPNLTAPASNRVCNALALLQCVASHPETKSKLVKTQIPLYLYPFLNTVSRQRPFEYLRLTSLGVIGALVKVDDPEIVAFLLNTEIIPLSLRIMETGTELSKTVATFIVQKILLDDAGLQHVCSSAERFYAITTVLGSMVNKLNENPSARLLKHIVRCYLRLSENVKARDPLRHCLPEALKDPNFASNLSQDDSVQRWLQTLLKNLNEPVAPPAPSLSAGPPGIASASPTLVGIGAPPALSKPAAAAPGLTAPGLAAPPAPGLSAPGLSAPPGMTVPGIAGSGIAAPGLGATAAGGKLWG